MESSQLAKKTSRESGVSDEERGTSPTRKSSRTKQKRKTSMAPSRDNEKSKRRTSKARQSTSQSTSDISDTLKFLKNLNHKVNSSTSDGSKVEQDENKYEVSNDLKKLSVSFKIDENMSKDVVQDGDTATAPKDRYSIGDFTSIMSQKFVLLSQEPEKNVQLENHLENDNEFNVTGILNLSGKNVKDNDIPTIGQRIFRDESKKCTGLILRDNLLTADGIQLIVDSILSTRANFKCLSLSNNTDIGDVGVEHIARLLQKKRSINFIALANTGITNRGVSLLANVLCEIHSEKKNPSSLEKLYISSNKGITDQSIDALVQIIRKTRRLKVLAIDHCSLSDDTHERLKNTVVVLKKKNFTFTG